VRFARGRHAELHLPLEAGRGYVLTLRLDPLVFQGATPQQLAVALNGRPLAALPLAWDPQRIGTYRIEVPAERVVDGRNLLSLDAAWAFRIADAADNPQQVPHGWETGFLLWYVMVSPAS
jgi:hypothetical protein